MNRLERELARREAAWQEGARHAVEQNTRVMLTLAAVPLGLAVRDDAMDRNYGVMQERFERMVREPGIERVLYAGAGDSILVSTDRALVGKPLATAIPARLARPVGANVVADGSAWQVIVPITGLNERLGVLVLTYRRPPVGTGGVPPGHPPVDPAEAGTGA